MNPMKECKWEYQGEWDHYWQTSCGGAHVFEEDGPKENDYKFCPYCGGELIVVVQEPSEEEDDD